MGRPRYGITDSAVEAQPQAMISHRLCAMPPGTLRRSTDPGQRLSYGSCMQNSQVWAVLELIGIGSVLAPNGGSRAASTRLPITLCGRPGRAPTRRAAADDREGRCLGLHGLPLAPGATYIIAA
jgi:hypothetical protein